MSKKSNWEKVVSVINNWSAEKRQAAADAVMTDFELMQYEIRRAINNVIEAGDGFRAGVLHAVLNGWMDQIERRINASTRVNEIVDEGLVEITLEDGSVRSVKKRVTKEV